MGDQEMQIYRKPAAEEIKPLAYTMADACKLLSISRSCIYDMAAKGKIKILHIGGKRGRALVPASEIARLIGGEAT